MNATSFNGDLSKWDTSKSDHVTHVLPGDELNVTSAGTRANSRPCHMFVNATFSSDLSKWDTSKVKTMSHMFDNATSFNGDLCWDTSNVEGMSHMFYNAQSFNGGLSKWDTRSNHVTHVHECDELQRRPLPLGHEQRQ